MEEEKEKLKFPMIWRHFNLWERISRFLRATFRRLQGAEACPKCGCKERVGQKLIRKLKEEGKLGQNMFPSESLVLQIPLFDPTRPPLASKFTIPVLMIYFDVCKECLNIYCTGVDLAQQQAQVQGMPNMKGMGFPQQNPRWS